MTLAAVDQALTEFLTSARPLVIALTGKWGSGKTYHWRSFVRKAAAERPKTKYAYISLFGITSLDDLKAAVFASATRFGSAGEPDVALPPWKEWTDKALRFARKGSVEAARSSLINDYVPFAQALSFATIKDVVICIDDLERRSDSLSIRDVLGLITMLREERNCRIVVILNTDDDALPNKDEFERLREKVFDWEVAFDPTPDECARIVFPEDAAIYQSARQQCARIGITNIRILVRIRRLIDTVATHQLARDAGTQEQIALSAVLLGWCFNAKGEAPDFDYVKKLNYSQFVEISGVTKISDEQRRWNQTLLDYGYTNTDDLDAFLCTTLERGYADTGALDRVLRERAASTRRRELEAAFHNAWNLYHRSFDPSATPVIKALESTFRAGIEVISLPNASATANMLRQLGRAELADELTQVWIDYHIKANPEELNTRRTPWANDIEAGFAAKAQAAFDASRHRERPLAEVVQKLARENAWGEDDVMNLVVCSADDYYRVFKTLPPEALGGGVKACLRFAQLAEGNPDYRTIGQNAIAALVRIAAESPLNERRVQSYGIDPDKFAADGSPIDAGGTIQAQ